MGHRDPAVDDLWVIRGASVVDVKAGTCRIADVAIEKGKIARVLQNDRSLSYQVEDVSGVGLWLIPGLIDCHVHLVGANVGREPFGRYLERHSEIRALRIAAHAAAFLAGGVTTIRHLGHGDPEHIVGVQQAIASGEIVGPELLSCGWAISQTAGHGDLPQWPIELLEDLWPSAAFCDGEEDLRDFVRRQPELGATWIKLFATQGTISSSENRVDLPNFNIGELNAVVDEAHRLGLRVAAHATGREGAIRALRAGVDTLEHGPAEFDRDFLEIARSSRTTFIPTLSVTAWAASKDSGHELPDWARQRSKNRLAGQTGLVAALHSGGASVAVGSDSGTLPRLMGTNEEIRQLAAVGFSATEILRMATINGATALGLVGDLGSIEAGKRADIVALSANPLTNPLVLADPSNVAFVVQGGRILHTAGFSI